MSETLPKAIYVYIPARLGKLKGKQLDKAFGSLEEARTENTKDFAGFTHLPFQVITLIATGFSEETLHKLIEGKSAHLSEFTLHKENELPMLSFQKEDIVQVSKLRETQ